MHVYGLSFVSFHQLRMRLCMISLSKLTVNPFASGDCHQQISDVTHKWTQICVCVTLPMHSTVYRVTQLKVTWLAHNYNQFRMTWSLTTAEYPISMLIALVSITHSSAHCISTRAQRACNRCQLAPKSEIGWIHSQFFRICDAGECR